VLIGPAISVIVPLVATLPVLWLASSDAASGDAGALSTSWFVDAPLLIRTS
jgi:hypothetical protein